MNKSGKLKALKISGRCWKIPQETIVEFVAGVKPDDGELWEALGSVRRSARKSGLTRKEAVPNSSEL